MLVQIFKIALLFTAMAVIAVMGDGVSCRTVPVPVTLPYVPPGDSPQWDTLRVAFVGDIHLPVRALPRTTIRKSAG
ncbi:hypothetical protein OG883_39935 [Streptomyces sp. NBC_01142]|uniref:hypothetical protein n=1 Tax=Streptomyces sp. NBC_01142 TaxID=2975865 RepID=UPI00224FCC70|nr:hypothetical protein [Streptomyces sp. NBC_01142]MCX4825877.1 hypothetical protein [Streptomyces sp. NBC_01142]